MLQKDQAFIKLKEEANGILSSIDLELRQDVASKLESLVSLIKSDDYQKIIASVSPEEIWEATQDMSQIFLLLATLNALQYFLQKYNYDIKLNPIFEIGLILCNTFKDRPNEYFTQKVINYFSDTTQSLVDQNFSLKELKALVSFDHPKCLELIKFLGKATYQDQVNIVPCNARFRMEMIKSLNLQMVQELGCDTINMLRNHMDNVIREMSQFSPLVIDLFPDLMQVIKAKLQESVKVEAQFIASNVKVRTDEYNRTIEEINKIKAYLKTLKEREHSEIMTLARNLAPNSTEKLKYCISAIENELALRQDNESWSYKVDVEHRNNKPHIPALLESFNKALKEGLEKLKELLFSRPLTRYKTFLSSTHLHIDVANAADENPYIKPHVGIPPAVVGSILANPQTERIVSKAETALV